MDEINEGKKKILNKIFLLYWEWDTKIEWDLEEVDTNSPEDILLSMYDDLKAEALSSYNFRSATKYVTLHCEEPETNDDPRYKYRVDMPEDFVKAVGFWADEGRGIPSHNSVDIQNFVAKTNLKDFTMAYTSNAVEEDKLDQWVRDYIAIYIASKASDVVGCSDQRKQFLQQELQMQRVLCANRDLEMSHQDGISSLNQFLEDCC